MSHRFQDQNHRLSDFQDHVDVVCPGCGKKATATADHEKKEAESTVCTVAIRKSPVQR